MCAQYGASKRYALGLAIGLVVLLAAGPARSGSVWGPFYVLEDMEGSWAWSQDPWFGDFTIGKYGDSYAGTLNDVFEGTYGDGIVDINVADNHVSFTRDGRYGIQYWDGDLKEEDGVLKIVNGVWLKPAGDTGPFTAEKIYSLPVNLGANVNGPADERSPDVSADGMTLYFDVYNRRNGVGGWDIFVSQASSPHEGFTAGVPLPSPVNSTYDESGACISDDGLTLYFASNRPGGSGDFDLYVTTRPTPADAWAAPVNLGPTVNSGYVDNNPSISADGLTLYFDSRRPGDANSFGGSDIYMACRATLNDPWEKPQPVTAVNTTGDEYAPDISSDGLTLYYDSPLAGRDLWMSRPDPNGLWQPGTHLLMPYSSGGTDTDPALSADGAKLYFVSDRTGTRGALDIWTLDLKKTQK